MTLHRKNNIENYKEIKKIIGLVRKVSESGYEVLFPIHPHTKKQIKSFRISLESIKTIEPVKYSRMLQLLCDASLLITDSGGLQKEAYWLNTPCITLRKSTEWIETLQGKHNKLIGNITRSSYDDIKEILKKNQIRKKNFSYLEFGRGNAAKKIVSLLERNISKSTWRETRIKLRPQKQNNEVLSMVTITKLLINKKIKNQKRNVSFWYWNRIGRSEPVYFENTKYAKSAQKLEKAFEQGSELYEQDLVDKKWFREMFGGTFVRFWRILKDEILRAQKNNPYFCSHFQKISKEFMDKYKIVGEPYRTQPFLSGR